MPAPVGTSAQGSVTNASSLTFAHDSGATGARRATAIFVEAYDAGAQVLTGVTYNGQAATQGASSGTINTSGVVRIYAREAPATGSNNVVVSADGLVDEIYAQAQTFENVNQAGMFGTQTSANGNGSTAAPGALTLGSNDIGLGCVFSYSSTGYTITESDTLVAETQADTGRSAQYGDANLSWTFSLTLDYVSVAVPLIHDAGAAQVDQEGFRVGLDDANEAGHTWAQAQDTNDTKALGLARLVRFLLNATGDLASTVFSLYAQKNGSGGYTPVPVGPSVAEIFDTVSYGAIGTGANGTTTVAPSFPAGITAGQYLTLHVSSGATNSETPTTPAGWALLATGASTDGAFGVDTGPRRMTVFGRVADGTETGTVTVAITNGNTCRGTIIRWTRSGSGTWDVVGQGADDSTSGTGVSMTFASMNWNTGDAALVATSQRVDGATQSAQSLTASGVTYGARTNRAATAVTTGNDHRHTVDTFAAITSTSNVNAAPTWAYTASAAASAGGVIVRLRAYTAPVTNELYVATSANITGGGEATTARLTAPSGKSTSDFVTGRRWDDENGTDALDLTADDYTELEWSLNDQAPAANGDYWDLRVYAGGLPLDTYSVTPRLTIGGGITGTLDATLGTLTSEATGQVVIAGTLDRTLGALTLEAAGGPRIAAALDATLGTLTLEATLELVEASDPVTGTLDATLGAVTTTATGQVVIAGTLDRTLGAATLEALAGLRIAAALDATLGAVTLEGTMGQGISAALDATLGAVTVDAQGQLAISATLDQALGAVTLEASGRTAVTFQLDATLGAATLEARAQLVVAGSLDATLGAVTLEADGVVIGEGLYLDATLGAVTLEGSATVRIAGAVDATLGAATLEALAGVRIAGTLDATLGAVTLEAEGTVVTPREFTLDATLGAVTLEATGTTGGPVIEPEQPTGTGGGVLPVRYRTRAPRRPVAYVDPLELTIRATEPEDVVVMSLTVVSELRARITERADRAQAAFEWVAPMVVRATENHDWVRSRMTADWAQDDADVESILRQLVA